MSSLKKRVSTNYLIRCQKRDEFGWGQKGHDVVASLEMLTKEKKENYSGLTDSMKVDYVKMIVHMVGDLHCPMHAGRLSDKGGNKMRVKWFGQNTNLYSVWDSKIIESAIYEYVENLSVENPNLSYQYVYDFSQLLEDRLLVAGYRLAYVLNSIFD